MFQRILTSGFCFALAVTAAGSDMRIANAARDSDLAAVRNLIGLQADINTPAGDGSTALHWAAVNDNVELAALLLQAHASVSSKTRNGGLTPLFMAARNGSAPMLELLIKAGADVNSVTENGTTVLMMAAASGNADAVKTLLDHGADINAKETTHGQTALMFAASLNRAGAIRELMARKADAAVTSKVTKVERVRFDAEGNVAPEGGKPAAGGKPSAEQTAAAKAPAADAEAEDKVAEDNDKKGEKKSDKVETADGKPADGKKPQQGRAERGATSMGGQTALLYAARDGQKEAAIALLDGGADVNQVSADEKTTPVVMAIMNGHFDLGKILLDRGANPNLANVWGLAALYATIDVQWAPYAWFPQPLTSHEKITHLDLMKALIAKGADVNQKLGKKLWVRSFGDRSWVDPAGATPLLRAAQSDDIPAMQLLVASGADPKIATTGGDTALMVAAGLGWAPNNSTVVPNSWLATVQYCLDLGLDVNAVDAKGYTTLHGVAFRGDDDLIKFLVGKGAKTDAKTKAGDTIADMANGPIAHSIPHPETVALLEKLGSTNSHNCRSDQCLVETKPDPKPGAGRGEKGGGDKTPAPAAVKPAASASVAEPH